MLPLLSLCLVLAGGLPAAGDPSTQRIIQTISTTKDGTTTVDERFVDAAATTLHAIDGDGRIVEATWHPRQR
jgi:hypothetical protein